MSTSLQGYKTSPKKLKPQVLKKSVTGLTITVFVPDVDVTVLEAGSLLGVLVGLKFGY